MEEVDPIRGQILIILPDGEKIFVGPEELTISKPEIEKVRRHHKRQKDTDFKENTQTATDTQEAPPSRDLQAPQITDLQPQPSTDRETTLNSDFDFTMYVQVVVLFLKLAHFALLTRVVHLLLLVVFLSLVLGVVFRFQVFVVCVKGGRLFLFCVIFK